jgi:hypothetical protein
MKNYSLIIIFLLLVSNVIAQRGKERNHSAGNFHLEMAGYSKGYLKPFMHGDTLVYTVKNISDTLLVRKKCDSLFYKYGKRYYLQYRIKSK